MIDDYKKAHIFSMNHKENIMKDEICGCFHCLAIFQPKLITEWINDTCGTAVCPYCEIDAVIGQSAGFPITTEFLLKMQEYWFGGGVE